MSLPGFYFFTHFFPLFLIYLILHTSAFRQPALVSRAYSFIMFFYLVFLVIYFPHIKSFTSLPCLQFLYIFLIFSPFSYICIFVQDHSDSQLLFLGRIGSLNVFDLDFCLFHLFPHTISFRSRPNLHFLYNIDFFILARLLISPHKIIHYSYLYY